MRLFGNNAPMKRFRKWLSKRKKVKVAKDLQRELSDLQLDMNSKDIEIDSLQKMLASKSELLEKAESTIRVKDYEIEQLMAVIVRDRLRVEAESKIGREE